MTQLRKVAGSSLTAIYGCEDFQPGRPGMGRMAGQGPQISLCGSHQAPWEIVVLLEGATQHLMLESPGARKQRCGLASCIGTSNCSRSVGDVWGIH